MSISDASAEGGAVGEAAVFLPCLYPQRGNLIEELHFLHSEESCDKQVEGVLELCSECRSVLPEHGAWGGCDARCSFKAVHGDVGTKENMQGAPG